MRDNQTSHKSSSDGPEQHNRAKSVEYITCRRGERQVGLLVELSETGMRVFHAGSVRVKEGEFVGMMVTWRDTEIAVKAQLTWQRKISRRKHILGFRFVDLLPNTVTALQNLCRVAKVELYVASAEYEEGRNRVPILRFIGKNGFPFNGASTP